MTDRELLEQAAYALRSFSLAALSVSSFLEVPYRDMPSLTPWTRTIEPEMRRAHDLSMVIRKHLEG
jgi:hypothetical protein